MAATVDLPLAMPPVRPMTMPRRPLGMYLLPPRLAARRPANRASRVSGWGRAGPLALAPGTHMGAPPRDPAPHDGRPAPPARLARSAVHVQIPLELARDAAPIDVVPDGGAALGQGILEHRPDGPVQPGQVGFRQGTCRPRRVDPGSEQRLIRVDVTDARHPPLIQQHRLDRRPPPRDQ